MLGNDKNVFWEALILTCVVFAFGFLIGVIYENNNLDKVNEFYINSEISLMDVLALNDLVDLDGATCESLIGANLDFADRIYQEAIILEDYENAGKINDGLKLTHKRYDLMRTLLWINAIKTREQCSEEFSTLIYLYNYEEANLNIKAKQNVWATILYELKQEYGREIVLIPLAADSGFASLDALIEKNGITQFPAAILNSEVLYELSSVEDLRQIIEGNSENNTF